MPVATIQLETPRPIVRFSAGSAPYVPVSTTPFAGEVAHTAVTIPLGHSRYGGPVIDLPPGLTPPRGQRFAAQLDLARFAAHDSTRLLPRSGHLFVFANIVTGHNTVIHADVATRTLVRTVVEHDDHFYTGVLIKRIRAGVERWTDRFHRGEWSYFAGADRSAMLGLPVHCQWSQREIERRIRRGTRSLLQVGQNGFNDEGVFSVLIQEAALRRRDFSRCEVHWAQS